MFDLIDFEPWWRFGVALLIGALLGLEREFIQQKEDAPDIAGIRTFLLISLAGAVSAYLVEDYGLLLLGIVLGGLLLLTAVSYVGAIFRKGIDPGITTEVAVVLTFLYGVMVMGESVTVAIALAVLTSLFLALKGRLHRIIRNMNTEDLRITLQFALVAAVILPLLPDRALDPYGLLNPFEIWLMVVLISGIGFSGYVMMKVFGASRGINLTGLMGGLASSTATTISFSTASKENPEISTHYARAVVLASIIMIPRVLLLVFVVAPALFPTVSVPLAVMFLAGLLVVFYLQRKYTDQEHIHRALQISNPLNLTTAIKFGFLFALVLIVIEFSQSLFGDIGVYAASAIAGLTDADAITLSVSRLFESSQVGIRVAGVSIVLAVIANTIAKGFIVHLSGTRQLRDLVVRSYVVILIAGVVASLLVFWPG